MTSSSKQHGASAKRRSASPGGSSRSSSSRSHSKTSRTRASAPARTRRPSALSSVRSWLSSLSRPVLVLLLLAALAATVWSFYPVARVQYREERGYAQLKAEYDSVQARNARLKKQVARLQTSAGVEDEAREDGLVLPGEHPVVVTDKSQPATQAIAQKDFQVEPEQQVEAAQGPWTPVLDFIFGVQE